MVFSPIFGHDNYVFINEKRDRVMACMLCKKTRTYGGGWHGLLLEAWRACEGNAFL